jgi:hypothetical protein
MDDFANPELALHPENLAHNARVLSNIRAGWLQMPFARTESDLARSQQP